VYPILIDFGQITLFGFDLHLRLPSYGFFYALALVIGWLGLRKLGRERHPDAPWTDIYFLSAIVGIAGARALNGLTVLPDVLAGRLPPHAILVGGGVWLGGALSGAAMYVYFMQRYGIDKGFGMNAMFTVLPLAHAIGRVGCFLGGCCYGAHCDLPWAVTFTSELAHKVNATPLNVSLHPTQLYEIGVELINFAICYALWRSRARGWSIMLIWFGLYGGQRFVLEFFRADYRGGLAWLSTSQWLSLGMMLLAATIVFTWIRRGTLLNRPATEDTAGARSRK
jgi:phosphatidylglycerol:prolipoprotein diacylglycerol transferase